ncbi:hypothetical protein HHI36_022081, partial [Cryptolaemus montrouzieri]
FIHFKYFFPDSYQKVRSAICQRRFLEVWRSRKMNSVLLESRPFRPFKSSEEYLYAMKEDLAEWLQIMYPHLNINVENFMEKLETGVALCEFATIIDEDKVNYH